MKNLKRVSKPRNTHSADKGNPGEFDDAPMRATIRDDYQQKVSPGIAAPPAVLGGAGEDTQRQRLRDSGNVTWQGPEQELKMKRIPAEEFLAPPKAKPASSPNVMLARNGDGSDHWSGH